MLLYRVNTSIVQVSFQNVTTEKVLYFHAVFDTMGIGLAAVYQFFLLGPLFMVIIV